MINHGDLKSLGPLWVNLALNQRYKPYVETEDILTFQRRFENEGSTFITVILPRLGKSLDRYHATSVWDPPEGFQLQKDSFEVPELGTGLLARSSEIPIFLGRAIKAALSGDSIAVDCVRQLSLIFYKLEVGYGEEMEREFLERFCKTDLELLSAFDGSDNNRDAIIADMGKYIKRILCNEDPCDITPTHGGGATACRTPNWKKHHRALVYYQKLDVVYPYSDFFFLSCTHLSDELDRLMESQPGPVPTARVVLVPKDSRGPRVISCEPAEMMFIQQGIMRKLYKILEAHPLTSGRVNFTDQTINQELARRSSKGELALATIDLSDASDRVSLELVRRVFPENWFKALEASRSEETVLPNSKTIKLNKFAPMGSSCCFPVEALLFWACAVASIRILGQSRGLSDVYVYGDDIICDSTNVDFVMIGLEKVGLKVNRDKTYLEGPFRESCGGDYHLGVDVTPVRLRQLFSGSRASITTTADLINSFVAKFGYADSTSLISVIETEGGYVYPRSDLRLPGVIHSFPSASNDAFFRRKWNSAFQRFEHRILACTSLSIERQPPNWEELFRKLLSKGRSSEDPLNGSPDRYRSELAIADAKADPGWYTDPHSVVTKWVWTWLG